MNALLNDLHTIALGRELLADAKSKLAEAQAAFDAEHAEEIETIRRLAEQLSERETALKNAALAEFEATQNKKPVAGVQIKVMRKVEFDPADALEWVKAHQPNTGLLVLDGRAYEKRLKAARENDFRDWDDAPGDIVDVPQAQIASDLSAALSPEPGAAQS